MFVLFILLVVLGLGLLVAGIASALRTRRPLAFVAMIAGLVLGAGGLVLLSFFVW